jgi:hypothetical protein
VDEHGCRGHAALASIVLHESTSSPRINTESRPAIHFLRNAARCKVLNLPQRGIARIFLSGVFCPVAGQTSSPADGSSASSGILAVRTHALALQSFRQLELAIWLAILTADALPRVPRLCPLIIGARRALLLGRLAGRAIVVRSAAIIAQPSLSSIRTA